MEVFDEVRCVFHARGRDPGVFGGWVTGDAPWPGTFREGVQYTQELQEGSLYPLYPTGGLVHAPEVSDRRSGAFPRSGIPSWTLAGL